MSNKKPNNDRVANATTPDRPERMAFGANSKLAVYFPLDRENFFHYYFTETNVPPAKAAYYDFVKNPATGDNHKVQDKGETLYLMRLPMEYREQDLLARRENVIKTMQAPDTGGTAEGQLGAIEGTQSAISIDKGGFDPNSPYQQ